jgi:hypothetical protein
MVPPARFELATPAFITLQLSLPSLRMRNVRALDFPFIIPTRSWVRCSPSSLYTFPFRDLARDCHFTGFPDFDECSPKGFPLGTQK